MQTSAWRELHVAQDLLQPQRAIFERQPPPQIIDHLADGDGLFVHLKHRAGARALQNLLEGFHQVDDVGRDLRLGAFGVHEFADRRVRPDGIFDLLLLHQHLRR